MYYVGAIFNLIFTCQVYCSKLKSLYDELVITDDYSPMSVINIFFVTFQATNELK